MSRRSNIPYKERVLPVSAYESFDSRWRAARFAMGVVKKMAEHWGCSVGESYLRLDAIGEIEDDLICFYDILHTQGYGYIVPDIACKWEALDMDVPSFPCSSPAYDTDNRDYEQVVLKREMEGKAIALISEHENISISEAMGLYLSSPAMSRSIDDYCVSVCGEDKEREMSFLRALSTTEVMRK